MSPHAGETEQFASTELARYLRRITGQPWRIVRSGTAAGGIQLKVRRRTKRPRIPVREEDEAYTIDVNNDRVALSGGSPRAVLFAVYAFLEDLGCRWFSPRLACYRGVGHEFVPRRKSLAPPMGRRVVRPSMLYRDWLIEECRSQSIPDAIAMIDWMAKVRANVFFAPIDYQHSGRFTWENIRASIIPEISKRGLILTVGGHGYENFLHPEQFFDKHPDWFALIDGERSANSHCAFESANPVALKTFSRRVAEYIEAHPEIDILGLLPPDIVKWSESPEALAQGSPSRRQAIVTEAVRKELKRRNLAVGLETYAYDLSEPFPENIKVHEDIIVTLALFYQTHRGPIYDPESMPEGRTATALHDWTRKHRGVVGYLPYHRRYVWQSRPVVYPTVLWTDMRYLHDRGIRAVAGFAEPGDWLTYELQHYLFARISEHVFCDIGEVVADYCQARFGPAGSQMISFFWLLEKISLTSQKLGFDAKFPSPEALRHGESLVADATGLLRSALTTRGLKRERKEHVTRLQSGLRTITFSFELMQAETREDLERGIRKYLRWVHRHSERGLFVEAFALTADRLRTLLGRELVGKKERERIYRDLLETL